jgi:hypothetical protein
MENKELYEVNFDGILLKRGFWLYMWKIKHDNNNAFYYVGRTGDTASPNAASPFNRMATHFNFRSNAKGNCITRQLKHKKINPTDCSYQLLAYGPIFPEQKGMENHKVYRDKIALLEAELAYRMKNELGYEVLGSHPKRKSIEDAALFNEIWHKFKNKLL